MKILNGKHLADFIKQRQLGTVQGLVNNHGVTPKLAIIQCKDDPVINTYVKLKKSYGADIGIDVDIYFLKQNETIESLKQLNNDPSIHGIIIQLPLPDTSQTNAIVNLVAPGKDVDALGPKAQYQPATPKAILWLLAGYNVDLAGKEILLIGRGKLVGAPLETILKKSGYKVKTVGREVDDLASYTKPADVIITATGSPAILFPSMIKQNAVVVDAGVASEAGKTVGDLHPSVYERRDLTITPAKGGVGPLTVSALFDNVILAAQSSVS